MNMTVHSNLGYCDTFLKIVSLLENYRSEWGKRIQFWKALCTGFSKIPKSLPYIGTTGKKLRRPWSRICRDACVFT